MLEYVSVLRFATWLPLFWSRAQATGSGFWLVPDGDDSDLTQTFPADTALDLSWSGQPALSSFTDYDNATTEQDLFNLFVTGFEPGSTYSELIATGINLSNAGKFRWDVAIPSSQLALTQEYVLRFIIEPNNTTGFPSPGFLIQGGSSSSSSSSSISSTSTSISISSSISTSSTTSPASSTSTSAAPPLAASGGLSTGAKVAIGVVIPVVFLALLVGAYSFYWRKRKAALAAQNQVSEMQGYKDTPPNYPDPVELIAFEPKGEAELPGTTPKAGIGPIPHELP